MIATLCLAALPLFQDGPDPPVASDPELLAISTEIQAQLEELSGKRFVGPVQVKIASTGDLVAYARKRLVALRGEGRLAAEERAAKLLGLVPADLDLSEATFGLLEEQVGGFYDPAEDTFYLMEGLQPDLARLVMAHELTHALDDQRFDLDATDRTRANNTDSLLAHHAVIEGSAMALMTSWLVAHAREIDEQTLLRFQAAQRSERLEEAPPYLWKPLMATYVQGGAFLRRRTSLSSMGSPTLEVDRDAALRQPPLSTEQILHPPKYWDPERRDEPRSVEIDPSGLPEGWTSRLIDTFGELGLALVVEPLEARSGLEASTRSLLRARYTGPATTGWGGDRWALAEGPEGAAVLKLVTAWDSPRDAEEFLNAVQALRAELFPDGDPAFGDAVRGFEVRQGAPDLVVLEVWEGLDRVAAEAVLEGLAAEVEARD